MFRTTKRATTDAGLGALAILFLSALLLAGGPASAEAQVRVSVGWWEWGAPGYLGVEAHFRTGDHHRHAYEYDAYDVRDRDRDRWDRDRHRDRRAVPAFCRNGRGHPVHGRRWCRDRFGYDRIHVRRPWVRTRWDDAYFRIDRRHRYGDRHVEAWELARIVGPLTHRRLVAHRDRMGFRGTLHGRWIEPRGGGLVLQVRAGIHPLAELSDLNRDGRVDVTLLARF